MYRNISRHCKSIRLFDSVSRERLLEKLKNIIDGQMGILSGNGLNRICAIGYKL